MTWQEERALLLRLIDLLITALKCDSREELEQIKEDVATVLDQLEGKNVVRFRASVTRP